MLLSDKQTIQKQIVDFVHSTWRERIQADGGDILVHNITDDGAIHLIARGECARCPITDSCLKSFLQQQICDRFGPHWTVSIVRKLPYFWSNS